MIREREEGSGGGVREQPEKEMATTVKNPKEEINTEITKGAQNPRRN
jgi:hypothetical protein